MTQTDHITAEWLREAIENPSPDESYKVLHKTETWIERIVTSITRGTIRNTPQQVKRFVIMRLGAMFRFDVGGL